MVVAKGNRLTAVRRPRLLGVTVRGGVVELLDNRGNVLAMTVASSIDGNFVIQPVRSLKIGLTTLRFRVRDTTGRQSALSAPLTFNVVNRLPQASLPGRITAERAIMTKAQKVNPLLVRTRQAIQLAALRKSSLESN